MRYLGALGFLLFWILAASGLYLYLRFDTSAAGAYRSIGELEWWFGGVLRSVHRYAADAFVVVTIAHLVREAWLGRFRGWRTFTWISGVPLVWLLYASGLIGYWLVWDTRSQFSFLATLEWTGLAAG
jgi:quinol-cytochrome oxidoreductase complex cytochrome b subunit